ncbi:MAG: CAP domain-containing protein [Propionibacteriaceae bacterium]|jgi:uncharacterized protein YkwD|nr:CAP domain-containing protein [Propionibacteriaceae bacterium]
MRRPPPGLTIFLAVGVGVGMTMSAPAAQAEVVNVTIDTSDMESVRAAYNDVYLAYYDVPLDWTGNTATCDPGTISQDFIDAEITEINYFRALNGLAPTAENKEWSISAQANAMLNAANGTISHTPVASGYTVCVTEETVAAARPSNLGMRSAPFSDGQAIRIYMSDRNDVSVGHRAWILSPFLDEVGVGHTNTTDTLFHNFGSLPTGEISEASWPSKGYFPYENLPYKVNADDTLYWSYHSPDLTGRLIHNGWRVSLT